MKILLQSTVYVAREKTRLELLSPCTERDLKLGLEFLRPMKFIYIYSLYGKY